MRTSVTILGSVALLAVGYGMGTAQILSPTNLFAQADARKAANSAALGVDVSDETKAKIKAASEALKAAADALIDENKYRSAIKGVNCFTVLTGGGNAVKDLENSAVVDPETFAALYADLAVDSVAAELGRDADGRLTYKGRLIRMYPMSVLRGKYAIRADITGEELLPTAAEDKSKSKKRADGSDAK